jgi:hypothetical protein
MVILEVSGHAVLVKTIILVIHFEYMLTLPLRSYYIREEDFVFTTRLLLSKSFLPKLYCDHI